MECVDETSCGLAVGEQCLVNQDTGSQFCAYLAVDYGGDVDAGASGNVTLIGTFANTINLGGSNLSSAGSGAEVVIGAFSTAGVHLRSARQGGRGQANGMGIAVASDGQLYCVGHYEGSAEFGGEGHAAVGMDDGLIVGLNPLRVQRA